MLQRRKLDLLHRQAPSACRAVIMPGVTTPEARLASNLLRYRKAAKLT
jgi:hypothetical protein